MRAIGLAVLSVVFLLATASPARADGTAFWGLSPSPTRQSVKGFAFGLSFLVIGFEGEYANTTENQATATRGLRTGMINGLVQTPTKTQFYLTAGGGFFREYLGNAAETSFGTNIGGGVKIGLLGPLRLRLDYRVLNLRGTPVNAHPQRFYAGANFSF